MDKIFGKDQKIDKNTSQEEKISIKIINSTIEKLKEKYDIHPCGMGIDGEKGSIDFIEISFEIFKPMEKEELRIMLFDCMEKLLDNFNENEEIRTYLKNYPFHMKNVGIVFFIKDENGKSLFHPNISVAFCSTKGIFFNTRDSENQFQYKEKFRETHKEALALVKKYRAEKGK